MHRIDLKSIDLNLLVVFDQLMRERNVTRAAAALGRTQPAISHALQRLRLQLHDPLLVKVDGVMQPTARALHLAEELRPILHAIARVMVEDRVFDAKSTSRTFRIAAPDFMVPLFTILFRAMREQAPLCQLEWLRPSEPSLLEIAEGQLDLAILPQRNRWPDGITAMRAGEMHWSCFMRRAHPALRRWGLRSWQAYPHIVVGTGIGQAGPVEQAAQRVKRQRQVAMRVPSFSAVAPMLAASDLIATLPRLVLANSIADHGLVQRAPPFEVEPMPHSIIWSSKRGGDPALLWLRKLVAPEVQRLFRDALP